MALLRANAASLRRGGVVQVDASRPFSVGPARSPEIARALEALLVSLERLDRAIAEPHTAGPHQAQAIRAASDAAVAATHAVVAEMEGHFEELGLDAAIRSWVEQQAGRAGLAFRFEPLRAPNRLESGLETACFRVAQEEAPGGRGGRRGVDG